MILGIVLVIIGMIALGYHGITYTTHEKVLKIGSDRGHERNREDDSFVAWARRSHACSGNCDHRYGSQKIVPGEAKDYFWRLAKFTMDGGRFQREGKES
jgi:hypothetical protein